MRKYLFFIPFVFLLWSMPVLAAENTFDYSTSFWENCANSLYIKSVYREANFVSGAEVICYVEYRGKGAREIGGVLDKSAYNYYIAFNRKHSFSTTRTFARFDRGGGDVLETDFSKELGSLSALYGDYFSYVILYDAVDIDFSGKLFDSKESAIAYLKNGDISGLLNAPSFDLEKDGLYDASVPLPLIKMTSRGYSMAFDNAADGLFVEIKGRWSTVDDIRLFKKNLMWKYEHDSVIRGPLNTWISVGEKKPSSNNFDLTEIGKKSFDALLSAHPLDTRSYSGGSNALGNCLFGYNDALKAFKDLANQPTSIWNSAEIYVRYYTIAPDGSYRYGRWAHWFDNLPNAFGSSGSQWDDKENLFTENQSESGLTTKQMNDMESDGTSRQDADAKPSFNYDDKKDGSVFIGDAFDAFMSAISALRNLSTGFSGFVNLTFGFLPWWATLSLASGLVICVLIGIYRAIRG